MENNNLEHAMGRAWTRFDRETDAALARFATIALGIPNDDRAAAAESAFADSFRDDGELYYTPRYVTGDNEVIGNPKVAKLGWDTYLERCLDEMALQVAVTGGGNLDTSKEDTAKAWLWFETLEGIAATQRRLMAIGRSVFDQWAEGVING